MARRRVAYDAHVRELVQRIMFRSGNSASKIAAALGVDEQLVRRVRFRELVKRAGLFEPRFVAPAGR